MQNCRGVSLSKLSKHLISRWKLCPQNDAMLTAAAAAADLPAEALPGHRFGAQNVGTHCQKLLQQLHT